MPSHAPTVAASIVCVIHRGAPGQVAVMVVRLVAIEVAHQVAFIRLNECLRNKAMGTLPLTARHHEHSVALVVKATLQLAADMRPLSGRSSPQFA